MADVDGSGGRDVIIIDGIVSDAARGNDGAEGRRSMVVLGASVSVPVLLVGIGVVCRRIDELVELVLVALSTIGGAAVAFIMISGVLFGVVVSDGVVVSGLNEDGSGVCVGRRVRGVGGKRVGTLIRSGCVVDA